MLIVVCGSFADGGECKSLHIHTSIDVRTFLVHSTLCDDERQLTTHHAVNKLYR